MPFSAVLIDVVVLTRMNYF